MTDKVSSKLSNIQKSLMIYGFRIQRFFESIGIKPYNETVVSSFGKLLEHDPYDTMIDFSGELEPNVLVEKISDSRKKYKEKNLPFKKSTIRRVLILEYWVHLNKKDYYQEKKKHEDSCIYDVDINQYSSYIAAQSTASCLFALASYSKNGKSDLESFNRQKDSLRTFLSKMELFAKDKKEDEFYTKSFLIEYSEFVNSEAKYDDLEDG